MRSGFIDPPRLYGDTLAMRESVSSASSVAECVFRVSPDCATQTWRREILLAPSGLLGALPAASMQPPRSADKMGRGPGPSLRTVPRLSFPRLARGANRCYDQSYDDAILAQQLAQLRARELQFYAKPQERRDRAGNRAIPGEPGAARALVDADEK